MTSPATDPATGSGIDCILWDHDGVLVDTEPWFFQATRDVLLDVGVEVTHERWLLVQARGQGLVHLASLGPPDIDLDGLRLRRDALYARLLQDNEVLIEGATEVLGALGRDHRMALVTTSLRRFVDQLHGGTKLLDHFDFVVTADDCARHKPHPEPYLRAMQLLGVTSDRCVAVEDSPRGLAAARAADLRCFVVRSRFMGGERLEGAHGVLDDLRDLPALLARAGTVCAGGD